MTKKAKAESKRPGPVGEDLRFQVAAMVSEDEYKAVKRLAELASKDLGVPLTTSKFLRRLILKAIEESK